MRPEILALWTHFILASFAVAAIAGLWLLEGKSGQAQPETTGCIAARLGAWALTATLLQIPAGLWMLGASQDRARESMLGANLTVSALFGGGVLGALWLMRT